MVGRISSMKASFDKIKKEASSYDKPERKKKEPKSEEQTSSRPKPLIIKYYK